jgi:hypothetical protein
MDNISEGEELSDSQKQVLKKGLTFLEKILRGKDYVDKLTLGEDCVEATRSYGMALKALRKLREDKEVKKGDPSIFMSYKNSIGNIINEQKKLGKDSVEEIQDIRKFFRVLRKIAWENTERSTEQVYFL